MSEIGKNVIDEYKRLIYYGYRHLLLTMQEIYGGTDSEKDIEREAQATTQLVAYNVLRFVIKYPEAQLALITEKYPKFLFGDDFYLAFDIEKTKQ
jgi:hypothetical protein